MMGGGKCTVIGSFELFLHVFFAVLAFLVLLGLHLLARLLAFTAVLMCLAPCNTHAVIKQTALLDVQYALYICICLDQIVE